MRRPIAVALTLVVLGAALLALAAGQSWVTIHVPPGDLVGTASRPRDIALTGNQLGGGLSALALAGLAAGAALLATRGKGRIAVAVLTVLIGLGAVALSIHTVLAAGTTALTTSQVQVVLRTGTHGSLPHSAAGWPVVGVVAAVIIVVAGVVGTRSAPASQGLSSKYEPPVAGLHGPVAAPHPGVGARQPVAARQLPTPSEATPDTEAAAWSALDRGEDPTLQR